MAKMMLNGEAIGELAARKAVNVSYDNTDSGLQSRNVQEAVDELNSNLTVLIQGTLPSGDTTLTLTDSRITVNSIIEPFYWVDGNVASEPLTYSTITVNNGSVVFEFESMDSNLTVGIRVI